MSSVRRVSVFLLLSFVASQSVQAVWTYTSTDGNIGVSDTTGPLSYAPNLGKLTGPLPFPDPGYATDYKYDPMIPGSGIVAVDGMMIATAFSPDTTSVVARNGNQVTTAYIANGAGNAGSPLTSMAHDTSYFQVLNVKGLGGTYAGWDYAVGGQLPGLPGQPPFAQAIQTGALSMLFDYDQYAIQFDLNGIDVFDPLPPGPDANNPTSNMYVDFYDRDGALVDHIKVDLGRLLLADPSRLSLLFQKTPSSPLFAGIIITTDDKFGLRYGAIAYDTPVAPSLLLVLTGLVWFSPRRGRVTNPGNRSATESFGIAFSPLDRRASAPSKAS